MLQALRNHVDEDEQGFTLIELLVVVIIIGILAAIAIPVFLNQRERAWRSAVQSDLRNAAVEMETYYTDTGRYPDDASLGSAESPLVTVTVVRPAAGATGAALQEYCLEGRHENIGTDAAYSYDSQAGGLSEFGEACT